MRKYNIWRPIILLASAFLAKSLVQTICILAGMEQQTAADIGFAAMIITAFVVYFRMRKQQQRR